MCMKRKVLKPKTNLKLCNAKRLKLNDLFKNSEFFGEIK
jgi:hypothetical protein